MTEQHSLANVPSGILPVHSHDKDASMASLEDEEHLCSCYDRLPKWGRWSVKIGAVLFVLVLLLHSVLFWLLYYQRRFLYHSYYPHLSRTHVMMPEQVGFDAPYREEYIEVEDGTRLHAFLFLRPAPPQGAGSRGRHATLYWFQGTAGNIGHRLTQAKGIFAVCDCNIFLISYRGYGLSNGQPNYRGIQLDTQAGLDFLVRQPEVDPGQIVLFGQSLGGAIALDLLARNRDMIGGCIVENSFTDIFAMHRLVFPIFSFLAHMLSDPWDSMASLRTVGRWMPPMLFLSGRQDELIPPRHMDSLYAKARALAPQQTDIDLVQFPEGHHIAMEGLPGYFEAFGNFFARLHARSKREL